MTKPNHDSQSPAGARKIEREVEITASPGTVWKALTDAQELSRWYSFAARVEPGPGGMVHLSWGPGSESSERIVRWEPGHVLQLQQTSPFGPQGKPLIVEYTLERRGGTTVLRLVHSGFGSGASWEDEYYDTLNRGWLLILENLRHYLLYHRGKPRHVAWPRTFIGVTEKEAWARLQSRDGLVREGTLPTAGPYKVVTAAGDRLEGEVRYFTAEQGLCATVENLNRSFLGVSVGRLGGKLGAGMWLSTYGIAKTDTDAWEARNLALLKKLFPEPLA